MNLIGKKSPGTHRQDLALGDISTALSLEGTGTEYLENELL